MDWVLEHLQVLFLIAVAVVAILQKLKTAGPREPGGAPPGMDPDQAERTRRIQEEIRRRIMERRGLAPVPPPESETAESEPAPSFPEAPPMIEEVRPFVVPPPESVPAAPADAPVVTEVRSAPDLQEQLIRQLQELEAARRASIFALPTEAPARVAVQARVLDLRQPGTLRQAVVWREILGPPVGLR